MTQPSPLVALYDKGALAAMKAMIDQTAPRDRVSEEFSVFEVYCELEARDGLEASTRFLFAYLSTPGVSEAVLIPLISMLFANGRLFAAANLAMARIQHGGAEPMVYEACLAYLLQENLAPQIRELYLRMKERVDIGAIRRDLVFNMASQLVHLGMDDDAAGLCLLLLEKDPTFQEAHSNLRFLGQVKNAPKAVAYFVEQAQAVARRFPRHEANAKAAPSVIVYRGQSTEEIVEAVNHNGFCVIRGGADPAVTALALEQARIFEANGTVFPTNLNDYLISLTPVLYRFDPAPIFRALLGAEAHFDPETSVLRRVERTKGMSYLPFHQDSTAFNRLIANIWTPLTPAGGAYPSLQLVRKRIDFAEQFKVDSLHKLLEIPAEHVESAYAGLLYEVDEAEPGDCVVFLGTTIHRSSNIENSTEARLSIEVRWS